MSEITPPAQDTTTAVKEETTAPAKDTTSAVAAQDTTTADKTADVEAKSEPNTELVAPVAPEKYELKLGKDSPLEPGDIAKIEALAKAQGLSNEQAQKLVEGKESAFAEFQSRQMETMKTVQKAWVEEIQADKEIGGKDFKENMEIAMRGLNRFADDDFKKVLSQTGLGNNPHLIRTFHRIGKLIANDKAVLDGNPAAPKKVSREAKLYPNMHKQQE